MDRKGRTRRREWTAAPPSSEALLERVADFYHASLPDSTDAVSFLRGMGLDHAAVSESFCIGACDGSLSQTLPAGTPSDGTYLDPVHAGLRKLGVLDKSGRETLLGCLVFPILEPEGGITGFCGIDTQSGRFRLVKPCGSMLWNSPALAVHAEIIMTAGIPDALSLYAAGRANVAAVLGPQLPRHDLEMMQSLGVQRVVLFCGREERTGMRKLFERFACAVKSLEGALLPNECLKRFGPGRLAELLESAETVRDTEESIATDSMKTTEQVPDGFAVAYSRRRYDIRGIRKTVRALKATVRVEHGGRLYVDTLDFYSSKARRTLCRELCRLFEQGPEIIEADIGRLVRQSEQYQPKQRDPEGSEQVEITPEEHAEAEKLGKDPNLIERIRADYKAYGLVGEEANKVLCYLAAVSRKTDEPLSVLILSSSGAGKSVLQDATMTLCPPEDVVRLTTLTGRALFYKSRYSLKHKVLALEEGTGAEQATYAIRNLISARELVIEATVKDLGTGRLTTMKNRVEGPTSVFITTTDPDTDQETMSRFFVTSVDESDSQTRAILAYQRRRQTLEGMRRRQGVDDVLRLHRNFQRLLKPVMVINPYAAELGYADGRLQCRRDQPKYLNLIKSVAFLRQMRKRVERFPPGSAKVKSRADVEAEDQGYIEVDIEDIRIANSLAEEILGHSLSELSRPARELLMLLEEMVKTKIEAQDLDRQQTDGPPASEYKQIAFTRRQIRDFTGWAHMRVHRYVAELVDLEYLLRYSRSARSLQSYHLAYEGQGKNGGKFMLGLTDADSLRTKIRQK